MLQICFDFEKVEKDKFRQTIYFTFFQLYFLFFSINEIKCSSIAVFISLKIDIELHTLRTIFSVQFSMKRKGEAGFM